HNLMGRNTWQKPANLPQYHVASEDVDVAPRDDRLDARDGLFQQRVLAEQCQQLFWVFAAAKGPKTCPAAAGHDYDVGMFEYGICSHAYKSNTIFSTCSGGTLRAASGRRKSSMRLGTQNLSKRVSSWGTNL